MSAGDGGGWPVFEDNEDKMVQLLMQIAVNTGGLGNFPGGPDVDVTPGAGQPGAEVTIDHTGIGARVGTIDPKDLSVVETDNLDHAEDDGTVEVQPGETKVFLRYKGQPHGLLAVGASDHEGATYRLEADSMHPVGGTTNSPLGSINDPFSFVDALGGSPAADRTEYLVHLDASATAPINVAGRLFVEVQR